MSHRYFALAILFLASGTALPAQQAPRTPRDSALHVLNRLAYGPTPGLVDRIAREGVMRWVDAQLAVDGPDDPGLKGTLAQYDLLAVSQEDLLDRFFMGRLQRRRARPM